MKVNLIKTEMVEFNLPEDKCEKIRHETFRMLTSYEPTEIDNTLPKMVVFKTKEEYMEDASKYNLDTTRDVLINNKGNIFCFIKEDTVKTKTSETKSKTTTDVAANTEENKGE